MTPAQSDAALVRRIFAESGYEKLSVAIGARYLVVSTFDAAGTQKEIFRIVAMPKQRWRVERSLGGRWVDGRLTGPLESIARDVLEAGFAGKATPPAPVRLTPQEHVERLRAARKAADEKKAAAAPAKK